ncbi:MAG: rhomboid family intramembrane serine protease [Acidimicrobiia bacterium]
MVLPLRDENPETRSRPWVTIALLVANIAIFVLLQPQSRAILERIGARSAPTTAAAEFTYRHAVVPCELRQGAPLTAAEVAAEQCGIDRPVRVQATGQVFAPLPIFPSKNVWLAGLAAMFLHGSWLHLLGNMLFLWVFGDNVENRFGHLGFALLYLTCGVIATAAQVFVDLGSTVPILGASGAIAGVMGAYLVMFPRNRVLTWIPIFLIVVIPLPAFIVLGIWFVMQFFTNPGSQVAWVAHVAGFVAGAGITFALRSLVGHPRGQATEPPPTAGW